jgi:hypothetical protein
MPALEEAFGSRDAAEARCRELEQSTNTLWLAYSTGSSWRVAATSLPRQPYPAGALIEARPRPAQPADPRTTFGRDVPPYAGV